MGEIIHREDSSWILDGPKEYLPPGLSSPPSVPAPESPGGTSR